MAKNTVGDWDTTPSNNSDIGGISIAEGMAAANVNNAIREMMAQIATLAPKGSTELDTDYQPNDDTLTSIAALGTASGKFAYTTGVDTWAEADITSAGRALLDDANAAAQRTTLGLGTASTVDVIDEDDFSTDSATRPPSQQSTKAYVDSQVSTTNVNLGTLSNQPTTGAHGLGSAPSELWWYLRCTSADGNFDAEDRLFNVSFQTQADANDAFTVWADSSVVGFALDGDIVVADKGASDLTLNKAKWQVRVVVRA